MSEMTWVRMGDDWTTDEASSEVARDGWEKRRRR